MDRWWLGSRDSNPDTAVQSRVSCRWTTPQNGEEDHSRQKAQGVNLIEIFRAAGERQQRLAQPVAEWPQGARVLPVRLGGC